MGFETMHDVIIIGAGPGGLMAAAQASERGMSFLLLEKNDKPGKKLLSTGGGQCNITHMEPLKTFISHYHEKSNFASKSISKFTPQRLIQWFEGSGVPIEVTEQGKVFPRSRRASDVLNALIGSIDRSEERIICNTTVRGVAKHRDWFQVSSGQRTWRTKNVLIATGGQSYPSLGTTGDGYLLAEQLGHVVVAPRPGLTSVEVDPFPLEGLAGLGLRNVSMTQWRDGKKVREVKGDLLITHDGVSGPVVLDHARYYAPHDTLTLKLTEHLDQDGYQRWLTELSSSAGKRTLRSAVRTTTEGSQVPQRLLERVFHMAQVPLDLPCGNLNKQQRKDLAKFMTALPLTIKKLKGYHVAMVTAGGVSTEEVVGSSMASRLEKGLYFAGEVLDVDGMSGGYNLQFAFSSGYVAAVSMGKNMVLRGEDDEVR